MPVTTRAAALKAQANAHLTLETSSTASGAVLTLADTYEQSHEVVVQQAINVKVEPACSSPETKPISPSASPSKEDDNHSVISLQSSENDENDSMHVSVTEGEIITDESTRGGKMVFMNGFAYLYTGMSKDATGWRCARRNENCKVVIHISKLTGKLKAWNGVYHCHQSDKRENQKREILNEIKHRVLDKYKSIKMIIEEEYRKANLSEEEKRTMPLPSQIESGLQKLSRKALPPLPQTQKFDLPLVYQETYSHQKFLIYDKRKTIYGGRLMIFASEEQLSVLYHSDFYLPMALSKHHQSYSINSMYCMGCKMAKVRIFYHFN
ncbi:unnamed protein product [Adineta ricciae]|uniref:FLYWCH-type domain-containing protein n=1 Tax=Adineta ricciae TaxID=249248 RepID=A0A815LYV9_ADIRI|nr:unnamed protein product [Adineta ricciae]